ncbi:MAG: methylenetetrahydrofolate reductase [Actinomycetota bacterium]
MRQVTAMNRGVYLEELLEATPTDFCVGVAAYPEKHVEAPNLEWDIGVLLEKQKAGAHYAVTQIFYDNELYFRFLKSCRDRGVTIPIVPGLKILTRREQVQVVPKHFGVTVPERLVEEIVASPPESVVDVGSGGRSSRPASCSTAACRRCISTSCRTPGRSSR